MTGPRAACAAAAAALVLAPAAHAASLGVEGSVLTVAATGSESVDVAVGFRQISTETFQGNPAFRFASTAPLALGPGCLPSDQTDPERAISVCPADGVSALTFRLAAGDDVAGASPDEDLPFGITLLAGDGLNFLSGSSRPDVVVGGRDGDAVGVEGGGRDRVRCGRGFDSITADQGDAVDPDCEVVNERAQRGSPRRQAARIRGGRRRAGRDGGVRLPLECPERFAAGCGGVVRIQQAVGDGPVLRVLGGRRYSLDAGEERRLRVPLAPAARALLARERRLRAVAAAIDRRGRAIDADVSLRLSQR